MKRFILLFTFCISAGSQITFGQNTRLNTSNHIAWSNFFGTFKVSEKIGIHTEYQWRRANFISIMQQSLLRVGINFKLNSNVTFRMGYAWIETFPYGEYPINEFGRDFTEHRTFEMVQLSHKEGKLDFSHRFILEQRFVGKYNLANANRENEFPLLNRIRYLIRLQVPLKGQEIKNKIPYLAINNEFFLGFGRNVSANVFDQNRLNFLLGYRFNKNLRIEAGYINQILQFGRQINGQNVFQNNQGFILNANVDFDLKRNLKIKNQPVT